MAHKGPAHKFTFSKAQWRCSPLESAQTLSERDLFPNFEALVRGVGGYWDILCGQRLRGVTFLPSLCLAKASWQLTSCVFFPLFSFFSYFFFFLFSHQFKFLSPFLSLSFSFLFLFLFSSGSTYVFMLPLSKVPVSAGVKFPHTSGALFFYIWWPGFYDCHARDTPKSPGSGSQKDLCSWVL